MGEIPPDAFINFAEAQQLIVPLTLHLFDLIIHDAPVLQTQLPPGAKLGINIALRCAAIRTGCWLHGG